MLLVEINEPKWEYDVHSLVKAFYPERTVKVISPERIGEEPAEIIVRCDPQEVSVSFAGKDGVSHTWEADESGKKNEFKRFFYRCLCETCGKELPWGNLTGIRPTKIAMGMLEQGGTKEEVYIQESALSADCSIICMIASVDWGGNSWYLALAQSRLT